MTIQRTDETEPPKDAVFVPWGCTIEFDYPYEVIEFACFKGDHWYRLKFDMDAPVIMQPKKYKLN